MRRALRHYRAALTLDSTSYDANWKAARAMADIAKQLEGDADSLKKRRDSLYSVGRGYAERAVRADSQGFQGLAFVQDHAWQEAVPERPCVPVAGWLE